jgi:hypothetical protein
MKKQHRGFIHVTRPRGPGSEAEGWPAGIRELALDMFRQMPNAALVEIGLRYAGVAERKTGEPPSAKVIERWVRQAGLSHLRANLPEELAEHAIGEAALRMGMLAGLGDRSAAGAIAALPHFENADRLRRRRRYR